MDPATRECWKRWSDGLREAAREDPACVRRIAELIRAAIRSVQSDGNTEDEQTRRAWQQAADSFRVLWAQGDLAGIAPVTSDLMTTLRNHDVDPVSNNAVNRLLRDPCLKAIAAQVPSLDCDPDFVDLLGAVSDATGDSRPEVS